VTGLRREEQVGGNEFTSDGEGGGLPSPKQACEEHRSASLPCRA